MNDSGFISFGVGEDTGCPPEHVREFPRIEQPVKVTKLKNGTEELQPLVVVTMMHLRELWKDLDHGGPIIVYELVQLCKNSHHKPFGKTGEVLESTALVTKIGYEYEVHSSIRNIVLSVVEGDGLNMTLVNPAAATRG